MTNLFKLFFLIIILSSCGEKKEVEKVKARSDFRDELDAKNKKESISLSEKQNAIIGWDTADQYTYQLQELFITNAKPISYTGIISDIIKKDSSYILKLYSYSYDNYYKTYMADVELSYQMLKDLLKDQPMSEKGWSEGCFIFKVTKIESMSPKLTSDIDFGSPSENDPSLFQRENISSSLIFDYEKSLIKFKGKLIAFYMFEKLKDTVK